MNSVQRGEIERDRWGNSADRIAHAVFRWIEPQHIEGAGVVSDQSQVVHLLDYNSFTRVERAYFYALLCAYLRCVEAHGERFPDDKEAGERAKLAQKHLEMGEEMSQALEGVVRSVFARTRTLPRPHTIFLNPPNELKGALMQWAEVEARQNPKHQKRELRGIRLEDFQHPNEARLRNTDEEKSLFDKAVSKVKDLQKDFIILQATAQGIRVNNECLPHVWNVYQEVCEIIGILPQYMPPLYVQSGGMGAKTVGVEKPVILLESMAASLFDANEIAFVLGREIGHIYAEHIRVFTLRTLVGGAIQGVFSNVPIVSNLVVPALAKLSNAGWHQYAANTADRMGYLTCQNREAALRVLIKQCGYPMRHFGDISTRAFERQVAEMERVLKGEDMSSLLTKLLNVGADGQLVALRAMDLMDWIEKQGKMRLEMFPPLKRETSNV